MAAQLEAKCTRCWETFVPHSTAAEDQVHGVTEDGVECGGLGVITRVFLPGNTAYPKLGHLKKLEDHAQQMPNCSDPDCEFHHPEVKETV